MRNEQYEFGFMRDGHMAERSRIRRVNMKIYASVAGLIGVISLGIVGASYVAIRATEGAAVADAKFAPIVEPIVKFLGG